MILRRLATSIRKQDWFAVVIETLIVVMGVYLGIQLEAFHTEAELLHSLMYYLSQYYIALQFPEY